MRHRMLIKKIIAFILVLMISVENFAAVISENDGSAFITKGEFDALKKDFADQITNYNDSIDAKIDGAIASYLAGIKVSTKISLHSMLNDINNLGFNYNNMAGYPFTNGNIPIASTTQVQEVYIGGTFAYQNLTEVSGDWGTCHHAGAGRANHKVQTGAGTAWRYITLYGGKCLESYMNLYESLNYAVSFGAAYHDGNNRGLAHTWESDVTNTSNNLNVEVKNHDSGTGAWLYKKPNGTWSGKQGLSSGRGMSVLSKKIVNTVNSAKKGYASPIGPISTSTTGQMYDSSVNLETKLTFTNPVNGETNKNGSYKETFNSPLFWSCFRGSSCVFYTSADTDFQKPVKDNAYDYMYWKKQYINTEQFNLTQVCAYAPTSVYGEPVRYYQGLPICKNDAGSGSVTFSIKPVATGGGSTLANQITLCFRSKPFTNVNAGDGDYSENLKNIKYKKSTETTWKNCDARGRLTSMVVGTNYDIMIEDFPSDSVLWVKPSYLVNNTSTGTQVFAYLTTTSNITIEVY